MHIVRMTQAIENEGAKPPILCAPFTCNVRRWFPGWRWPQSCGRGALHREAD